MRIGDAYLNGTILNNRYEIIKRLGKGGNSKVYLARDLQIEGSFLAIKQMFVEYVDYDQYLKAMQDFNREAEILSKLEHPSIPALHDFFLMEGDFFLAIQYIEGLSLEQKLNQSKRGWMDEKQVTLWGIQLCDTLNYLHKLNPPMIYRDLKPANVMLNEKLQQIFLIDFGVARFVKPSVSVVTAVGTFGYAPPELLQGKVTPASDIYSLGATMYHLLTGVIPELPDILFECAIRVLPRAINRDISCEMEKILIKALSTSPEHRFCSAQVMKSVLEEHLDKIINEKTTKESVDSTLKYPPKEWESHHKKVNKPIKINGRLKIYHQKKKMAEFLIKKASYSIGRQDPAKGTIPDIDLSLIDQSGKISRKHAQIIKLSNHYYFEDVGSTYGSLLNGEKLNVAERRLLRSGDRINLGETTLEFIIEKGTDQIGN